MANTSCVLNIVSQNNDLVHLATCSVHPFNFAHDTNAHGGSNCDDFQLQVLEISSKLPLFDPSLLTRALESCSTIYAFCATCIPSKEKFDIITGKMVGNKLCVLSPIASFGEWVCLVPGIH